MSDMPAAAAEIDLEGAVEAPLKGFIQPMLATLATNAFDDPDWLFEIKWDGYRLQAVVQDGAVRTFTRRGLDGATYFPGLLANPSWIAAQTAVVDGEVVAVDEQGVPDFPLLQEAISESRSGSRGSGGTRRSRRPRRPPRPAALPGVRPALPRRPLAAPRPARGSEAAPPERPARIAARALRLPRRGRRPGVLPGGQPARARGRRGQAPPLDLRAGPPDAGLAEDQDPARAGARRRRLDARRGQRQGPGGAGGRGLRGRHAAVRRQGRLGVHRQVAHGASAAARPARDGPRPVRPGPGAEGRVAPRDVGPAGARDPGGDRRLDAGRDRPPDRVQGHRRGPRPAGRDPRAGGLLGGGRGAGGGAHAGIDEIDEQAAREDGARPRGAGDLRRRDRGRARWVSCFGPPAIHRRLGYR